MLYQLTSSGFRCFCPFYRGGCEQSPPQGSCFFSSLGADARRPPSFFTRRYRMPCAAKKRRAAWRVSFFVITHRFCCLHSRTSQGRGSVRGEPLTGSPTRVQSPARRRPLLRSKSAAPKKKRHTLVCLFFFGAGYGSRTRLNGLGSRCNTDIPTLRFTYRVIVAYRRRFCNRKLCRKGMNVLSRRIPIEKSLEGTL